MKWALPAGFLVLWGAVAITPAVDPVAEETGLSGETVGVPWTGEPGVTETVAEIMAREAQAARDRKPGTVHRRPVGRLGAPRHKNPSSPAVSQWPPASGEPGPFSPQPIGPVNFKAISLLAPNESQFIPPDSMGDVGPAQILAAANGRIKVFSKTGVLGGLNADMDVFFTPAGGAAGTTDPQVRYDRLAGRWFVTAITIDTPNKVMIAVSYGSTITSASSFTFFHFQHDLVGPTPNSDTGGFADYDSLGVDRFALYIGTNTFNAAGTAFLGSTGFVVNKANLLAGTLTVTPFRQLAPASGAGPFAPRGVDNGDPAATHGYFIGADNVSFGVLAIRRISDPGGTPSISSNILLTVPTTNYPLLVPHLGMATSRRRLDALDDRLFAARIHLNKLTGVASLLTAHNIQVNTSCVAGSSGGRDGSRWYEIRDLATTPTLYQSGTLCDPAATNPRFFWIPSLAMSGQGHMALGVSTAGTNYRADVAAAGRYSGDPLGTLQSFSLATASSTAYNQESVDGQRWGDYSATMVDPADDMTLWTFQEYCDFTNSWGVQVVQLTAPPPATPSAASPSTLCQGVGSTAVTITGTSSSGSGFFDPGPDTGGPGYSRLAASVSGGVTVSSLSFDSPTQVTLNLSTSGATVGAKDVTITNPDGQSRTGTGLLTVAAQPSAPTASNSGPICAGATLQLSASTVPGAAYSWTGPNGFSSNLQNPSIPGAPQAASGPYGVTVTVSGCASAPGTTSAVVIGEGSGCSDGDACTQTDACASGICVGSNPVVCSALDQCHDPGVCNSGTGLCSDPVRPDGSPCTNGDACTQTDACASGACVGSNPVVCSALDQCHDPGVCDSGTGLCSSPVRPDGSPCTDGDACTTGDSCQSGACLGGPPRDADLDSHVDALCGGNDCNDADPLVWFFPVEVSGLVLTTPSPANPAWDDQGPLVGPGTLYDLVSGSFAPVPGISFPAAACLQSGGGSSYSDTRTDPPAGSGFWYLARARNSCGAGTYGSAGRDTGIPACP